MSTPIKILVVDDEEKICQFLQIELLRQGFKVEIAETGQVTLRIISTKPPDLVILDLGLPDMDGKEVIHKIREWSQLPIIVLSARSQEMEKVEALEAGADDYLAKPFGTQELLARVKVAMRHTLKAIDTMKEYSFQSLSINLEKRMVMLKGQEIRLTPTEYKLLAALAKQPGRVVTQSQLINEVWGKNSQGNSHYLRIYVQHLRQKLNDDPLKPSFIMTDPGVGYRLNAN